MLPHNLRFLRSLFSQPMPNLTLELETLASAVDTAWTIACATFVVMMQLGFAGSRRQRASARRRPGAFERVRSRGGAEQRRCGR